MSLMRRQDVQAPPQNQQPPRPTLREYAIKSAKKSTLLCIALAIVSIPISIIQRGTTFLDCFTTFLLYDFFLWVFLMLCSFVWGPMANMWWKKTTEASQNFWNQRL